MYRQTKYKVSKKFTDKKVKGKFSSWQCTDKQNKKWIHQNTMYRQTKNKVSIPEDNVKINKVKSKFTRWQCADKQSKK